MVRHAFTGVGSIADSMDVARRVPEEARVSTVPGGSFGPTGGGRLRRSYGMAETFDRIGRWTAAL